MSTITIGALVVDVSAGCLGLLMMTAPPQGGSSAASPESLPSGYSASGHRIERLSPDQIESLATGLDATEERIILRKGTEPAFTGDLVENKRGGTYLCRLCALPLFASDAKFESGTGWPSFFVPVDPQHVATERDASFGMVRTEILCQRCGGHLGHVFEDGPAPTNLRYCVNSASLDFVGVDEPMPDAARPAEVAYFAGGCFWGVEDRFQQVPGVLDAVSGYQGGTVEDPTYKQVCSGSTGHAESVRVTFDPSRVSYEQLMEWFFAFHDPTQMNRQGWDVGTQYRSAIFAADERQLEQARSFIERQQSAERFRDQPIATVVQPASTFYAAEAYHQDYHLRNGGSCPLPTR